MDYLSENQQSIKKTSHTYMKVGKVTPIFFFFFPRFPDDAFFVQSIQWSNLQKNFMLISHISPPVPLAQRIARWTSNPKVLGSIPRWDDRFFVKQLLLYSILTFSFFSLQLYPHPYAGLLSQKAVQNPMYQSKVQFVYLAFTASFRGVAVITSV